VAGDAFHASLAHYLDDGTDELDALSILLSEAAWTASMHGVTLLPNASAAVAEVERLLRPDDGYECDR